MRQILIIHCTLLALSLSPCSAQENLTKPYLERGELKQARQAVMTALRDRPENSELLFQLAAVQVFASLEEYAQEMHRLGLRDSLFSGVVPFLRFPVEPNPQPAPATNDEARQAIERLSLGLNGARETLAKIPDDWKGRVPMHLGKIRMDFNGDGEVGPKEELWRIVDILNPRLGLEEKTARKFQMHLDAGDARWLEGYCHFLSGLANLMLAYDTQRLFDHTGHLFFEKADSPFPFLASPSGDSNFIISVADGITFVHLLNFPLADADRMPVALEHFRRTIDLSRRSWACIEAEADDDYEWIPNPDQRSVIPGWTVTSEQIEAWHEFLAEAESVMAGDSLIPFWRDLPDDQGLNFVKIFQEPRPLDAVLWLQGTGAVPYLEQGRVVPREVWERLNGAFEGNFFGWAAWFN